METEEEILASVRVGKRCPVCKHGTIPPITDTLKEITIYGRNGPRVAKCITYRCNNRNSANSCRAGICHGYVTTKGHTVYEENVLQQKVLITSDQTGFDIEYLRELSHRIQIQSITFEGEAQFYNRFHCQNLPYDVLPKRALLCRKRISEAFWLYTYLEGGSRHNIRNFQFVEKGNIEDAILKHESQFKKSFNERWTVGHSCDVPGCNDVLVIDGGLKPHRPICAAKLSGVKVFSEAGVTTLIGCPKMPINEKKYCNDHENCETPLLGAKDLCPDSRKHLYNFPNRSAASKAAPTDLFVIESILDIWEEKDDKQYLVKWVGFPDTEATFEPANKVPGFIRQYYEDETKLGTKLPAPQIKHTKTVDGVKHHYLKWGTEEGDWLSEEFFNIVNDDDEIVEHETLTCNTRKSRDKRVKRHTLGLFVGASPCGVVRICEELYGSEAISQVYGIICEYLSNLSEKHLKALVYDDVCHLAAFAKTQVRVHNTEITTFFSKLKFSIDRFHFKNHIDKYCHDNYNPKNVEELKNVNSEVCEQLFTTINKFKNCRSMNQAHFFMFHFYNMDLHNLSIEKLANTVTHPIVGVGSWQAIENLELQHTSHINEHIPQLPFNCVLCHCGFTCEVRLKQHMTENHPETNPSNPRQCPVCDKILSNERNLRVHVKTHFKCSVCNEEFATNQEMLTHKKKHTFCSKCDHDFKSKFNLDRHNAKTHKDN
jgi:hypothetical protein